MKKLFAIFLVGTLMLVSLTGCTINVAAQDVNSDTPIVSQLDSDLAADEDSEFIEAYMDKQIPDFQMKNSNEELVSLREQEGNYVVYFARVDCEWCDKALPQIENLKSKGIKVISIYRRNTVDEVQEHLAELGFTFDNLTLCGMSDPDNNNVLDLFDLPSVPTTLAVRDGFVRGIYIGTETDSDTAITEMVTSSFEEKGV